MELGPTRMEPKHRGWNRGPEGLNRAAGDGTADSGDCSAVRVLLGGSRLGNAVRIHTYSCSISSCTKCYCARAPCAFIVRSAESQRAHSTLT